MVSLRPSTGISYDPLIGSPLPPSAPIPQLPRLAVAAQRLYASDTRTFPVVRFPCLLFFFSLSRFLSLFPEQRHGFTHSPVHPQSLPHTPIPSPSQQAFKGHKLDKLPSSDVSTNKEELLKFFRDMATIRRFETKAGELYRAKSIRGFCHLYSGQEACAVGIKGGLRSQDSVITAYRVHGWAYVLGWSVKAVMAELFGTSAGCSLGKGGSMHMYGENFLGGNGIVGAQVPVGAGAALAHQYLGTGGVNFALYGDGASNQGQVFEAYNIAKLWKLPVVFVCENNKYGMGTHDHRSSASTKYYTRGDYVPGIWVDGMDVLAVKQAAQFAIEFANNEGPLVMELETYRYHGHSMSDPDTTYRS